MISSIEKPIILLISSFLPYPHTICHMKCAIKLFYSWLTLTRLRYVSVENLMKLGQTTF
jgi:hypothetical protein